MDYNSKRLNIIFIVLGILSGESVALCSAPRDEQVTADKSCKKKIKIINSMVELRTKEIGALKIPCDTGGPRKNYMEWPPQGQS